MSIIAGDVGSTITMTLGEDVSAATTLEILWQAPSKRCGSWTADHTADGLYYTTADGDIGVRDNGIWYLQAAIEFAPGLILHSDIVPLVVGERLRVAVVA